jgi:hypothetical protein
VTRAWLAVASALLAASCSGHHHPSLGPPPEYERPVVMPWDAGAPVDPLQNLKGEEVTDDDEPQTSPADAGPAAPEAGGDAAPALSPDGGVS